MEIPYKKLNEETLQAVIEEFISREGTNYGEQEYSLSQQVQQVKNQLDRGDIFLSYDPETQSCQLQSRHT
jgi:uncharacterized protein YheU (UPF0270 family)